jgi:multiple sugar transport system permease protein
MQTVHKPFRFNLGRGVLYLLLFLTSLMMIVPFYWSAGTSLKLEQFIFANPPQWWPNPLTFLHYVDVITRIKFYQYFFNSLFVAVTATLGHVFFDTLAAYAFAKLTFPGRDRLFFFMLLAFMVPFQVNMIPLYRIMAAFHWWIAMLR